MLACQKFEKQILKEKIYNLSTSVIFLNKNTN